MKATYLLLAGGAVLIGPTWLTLGEDFAQTLTGKTNALPPAVGMQAQAGSVETVSTEAKRVFHWHVGHPHMGAFDTVVIPYDGALEDYGVANDIDARIEVDQGAFTGTYEDSLLLFENGHEENGDFERVRVDYDGQTLAFRYDDPTYASSVFDLSHPAIEEGVLLERALIDDPFSTTDVPANVTPTSDSAASGLVPIRGALAWRLSLEPSEHSSASDSLLPPWLSRFRRTVMHELPGIGVNPLRRSTSFRYAGLYDRMVALLRGRAADEEAARLAEARAAEAERQRREDELHAGASNPLTGLAGEPSNKPALMVKIDNVSAARPQSGINQADVVYEELVEYGLTRLAAVFHSEDATVGPVRSARTSDVDLLANLGTPYFANSGMNGHVQGQIDASDSISVNHNSRPDAYRREPTRRAPHNLYAESVELRQGAVDPARVPQALFEYRRGNESLAKGAQDVRGVALNFGHTKVAYTWDAERGGWARTQDGTAHVDIEGVQVAPENVIVQFVSYGRDEGGDHRSPKAHTTGAGRVMVLTKGKLLEGTWTRERAGDPLTLRTDDGETIKLTPGKTWVALAPAGGAMAPNNAGAQVLR